MHHVFSCIELDHRTTHFQISKSMGEVLVIQVGNNANYIGSHMWNSRGEDDEDEQTSKLYHRGLSKSYPRSIFVESPNNLGNITTLERDAEPRSSIWDGSMQTAESDAVPPKVSTIPDPAR
jgi:hypothetical protein